MMKNVGLGIVCCLLTFAACIKGKKPNEISIPPVRMDSTFLNYFRKTTGLTAAQGTSSLTLSDGRTLWLFGNAHINDYDISTGQIACTSNVKNAALISDAAFNMQTLNMGLSDFIPSNETNKYFIPLHAYQYGDTIFVFAKKEGGGNNTNTFIVKFQFPTLQFIQIDSFAFNNTNFGYTVFADTAKGFCFIYGLYQPNITKDNSLYLARFSMTSPHTQWQFYHPDQWFDQASAGQSIAQIPGENFSIRKLHQTYVLLTQSLGKTCNKGKEIYAQTSISEFGPFLNYVLVHTITDNINDISPKTYGVTLHPQFLNSSNEALVTYCVDGYAPCIPTCTAGLDNPDHYRIRTIRVPLKRISLGF